MHISTAGLEPLTGVRTMLALEEVTAAWYLAADCANDDVTAKDAVNSEPDPNGNTLSTLIL